MTQYTDKATRAWQKVLGSDAVIADAEGLQGYTGSLCAAERDVPCVLQPDSADAVREIVRIANEAEPRLRRIVRGVLAGETESE